MVSKKLFKIIWDRNALNNFKEILAFLSKQSTQAPTFLKEAILSRLDIIKSNAFIYETDKLKDQPNKEFRSVVVFSYRVTYQIKLSKKKFAL